ncbi:RNA 2',3'-cyclic phosphodiesterase [Rhodobacter sp. HX-7-19]|uniref:RNA 2',3'-cyclic phosphodiesterase n=1 Tax=Paragemmobacter kunshanensis TaxID=2583234 RepID=A0A6M1TIY5_9RHOB|nr:RNA 2',3'-cyclic phosphodiesterase [Rhodobacter kunshanensis]NGQ89829.1 RNA 2',3'-cyclic phosphodiesterase [Rhodobacter kunshanensis]
MIRAFLALPLPDPVLSALRVQQFLLPLPKKTDPETFHLTLVFLGEQPEPVLQAAHDLFTEIRVQPFPLSLKSLGLFGGPKPRAAWAGTAPSETLNRLQAKLEHAARSAGIATESRRFTPHVTLGRFPPPPPEETFRLERAIAAGSTFTTPEWVVDHFILYQSHQTKQGSRYSELARYDL